MIILLIFGVPLRGVAASVLFPCGQQQLDRMTAAATPSPMAGSDMTMMDMTAISVPHAHVSKDDCSKMPSSATCGACAAVASGSVYVHGVVQTEWRISLPEMLPPATLTLEQLYRPPRVSL